MKNIETRKFYAAYLRNPKGRGSWAFECEGETFFASSCLLYSEACKEARKHFADKAGAIYVLP
jgi:hypothetical protein